MLLSPFDQVPVTDVSSNGARRSPLARSRGRGKRQEPTDDVYPMITFPQSFFESFSGSEFRVFFTRYATALFFPLAGGTRQGIEIGTPVIGARVVGVTPVPDLEDNVTITFQLANAVCQAY